MLLLLLSSRLPLCSPWIASLKQNSNRPEYIRVGSAFSSLEHPPDLTQLMSFVFLLLNKSHLNFFFLSFAKPNLRAIGFCSNFLVQQETIQTENNFRDNIYNKNNKNNKMF